MSRAFAAAISALLISAAWASPGLAQTDEALQIAVFNNDPAAVDAAIRAGSNPRASGRDGSLLAHAALMGCSRSVRALLANGADPAAPGPNGGVALHAAFFAINGAALLGRWEPPDPARRAEALDIVRALAARKVGLDTPVRIGPTNMTPLMQAADAGALDVVRILLDAGANPNAANAGGYTALDLAVDRPPVWATLPRAQRVEVVRALLTHGARRGRAGLTPLARARAAGDPAIVALLEAR